jgi:hypothetical protein
VYVPDDCSAPAPTSAGSFTSSWSASSSASSWYHSSCGDITWHAWHAVNRHCFAHPGQRARVSNVFHTVKQPGAQTHRSSGWGSHVHSGQ